MSATRQAANKATIERFSAAMNSSDAELITRTIDELIAPDAVISTPLPVDSSGPQIIKDGFAMLHRAYPDLQITVEDMIAEGDKVVARNTVTGTHQGEYMGIAPTGNTVTYKEIFIARFRGGQIVETWGVVDVLAQLRQLGAIPASSNP
jgi:predicted ester cyclase